MSTEEEGLRKRIGSEYLIGCYRLHKDGTAYFGDIRGKEGDLVKDPETTLSNLEITCANNDQFVEEKFYSFQWGLDLNHKIIVKGDIKEVENNEFVKSLFDARLTLSGSNLELFNNFQKTIFNEVTGAQHTYIYELLQNANDYPYSRERVQVQFILSEHYLFFFHSGDYFNLRNIVGISSINQGEKKDNIKTIGYKGIGFKTVFVNNDYVYLQSGDWSLRFDENYSRKMMYGECPWALMPIPTLSNELDEEAQSALVSAPTNMRVKFALRHKSDASENLIQLDKVFGDNQILLFIPNVDKVEVFANQEIRHKVEKDPSKWIVSHFEYEVSSKLRSWVTKSIKSNNKIPEKFKDIETVRISFAVAKDGDKVIPVDNARVYNYLPTELKLGFKFLFNADFVPNGSRSGLHDIEWNDQIMEQCGVKFADWWVGLLQIEGEYDISSVFSILPDDYKSKDNYTTLFLKGFTNRLLEIPCIPVIKNDKYYLCKLSEIVDDEEGLVVSSNPILTDDEYYKYFGDKYTFAHPSIRNNEFLDKLLRNFNPGKTITGNDISDLCLNSKFADWLKVKSNNIKFLGFLLESRCIDNCWNYSIFLRSDGILSSAGKMHYNIDKHIGDLYFLSNELPRLDTEVRDALKIYSNWAGYSVKFNDFSPYRFAQSIIDRFDKYEMLFNEISNSVGFVHFLAITDSHFKLPEDYPIWLESQGKTTDRNNLFIRNVAGDDFKARSWVDDNWINYIGNAYLSKDKAKVATYLRERNGIIELHNKDCYKLFIESDNYIRLIAESIKDRDANIDFYHYLSSIQDVISNLTPSMRKMYTLLTTDGRDVYNTPITNVIFKNDDNDQWLEMANTEWMPDNCCLSVLDDYFVGIDDVSVKAIKMFLSSKQIIQNFSIQELFKCIKPRLSSVYNRITTAEISKDFLNFIFTNRTSIIRGDVMESSFKDTPIKCIDKDNFTTIQSQIYITDRDVMELYTQPWFDKESISICDRSYNDLFDGEERTTFYVKMGLKPFNRIHYLRSRILSHPDRLKLQLIDKTCNLSFHTYVSSLQEELTGEDFEKVKRVPIFVSSPTLEEGECFEQSTDLSLPSELLNEVISRDLVPISILGTIHSDYIISDDSKKYFSEKLANRVIDAKGLIEHITENSEAVSSYLRNEKRNINFWRWVRNVSVIVDLKSKLKQLPLLGIGCRDNVYSYIQPSRLHLSNEYSDGNEIEGFINEYVQEAHFVSAGYKQEGDTNKEWVSLFRAIGVTVDIKDIVFQKILPELIRFKQKSIVPILARYVDIIESKIKDDDSNRVIVPQLEKLQLYCDDGQYRSAPDVVVSGNYFDFDYDTFNEIEIGNLLSECYIADCGNDDEKRRCIKKLIILIADKFASKCENKTELRKEKLRSFVDTQDYYSKVELHFNIISELASAYNADRVGVGELIEELDLNKIQLYTQSEKMVSSSELYFSSVYQPDCDFMANGIEELEYVNELYCNMSAVDHKPLFSKLRLKDRFERAHLPLLRHRQFATYFWEVYADKKEYLLKYYITDETLKEIPCIPSKYGVKRPMDLYDYRLPSLQKIVMKLADGESLLPQVKFPEWIERIGLRGKLYFEHCFEYLALNRDGKDYRRNVIGWITETDTEIINKHRGIIANYVNCAEWLNGAKEWAPLKELVAIEWGNETLKGSFGGNKYVCSPSYMPEYQVDYNKLCDILGIKILTDLDFRKDKDGVSDNKAINKISKCLTYLAWKSGKDNWQEINAEYQKILSTADICTCSSISYFYNDNIKANPKSYTEDSSYLWYVGVWNGPMFGKIQEWVMNKINIKGDFDSNFLDDLFLDDFNDFIRSHEGNKLPAELLALLGDADSADFSVDEYAEVDSFDEDNVFEQEQHYNTTVATEPGIEDEEGLGKTTQYTTNTNPTPRQNISLPRSNSSSPQVQSEPASANVTVEPAPAGNDVPVEPTNTQRASVENKLRDKWSAKRNKVVGRPPVITPTQPADKPVRDTEDRTPEPFFAPVRNGSNGRLERSAYDKAKQNLKRKNTDAQNQADKAADQLDLFYLWQMSTQYTFVWYKYLLELQNSDKNHTSGRTITIDFSDFNISKNGEILKLSLPSINVPKWIENADVVSVTLLVKFAKLRAYIIRVSESEVELFVEPEDVKTIASGQKVRIYAEQTLNFIDSLETRFIQLDYADDYNLQKNLPDNVEFIYGPPGTGKTTRLVDRLQDIISGGEETINILVLTPTNKAADVIAYKLFYDDVCYDYIRRYGSTDSSDLIESGVLFTRDTLDMTMSNKNIVVATAARYSYDVLQPNDTAICDYHWDYIVVDEASMIDIITITYILYKGNGAHFIIAGDPKQIEPIAQNNIDIPNIL